MRIRADPIHEGKVLKRSILGDQEEFLKYKDMKLKL